MHQNTQTKRRLLKNGARALDGLFGRSDQRLAGNTPQKRKIHIVLEGFRREVTVNELCRREGIKPNNFYSWTKEFMEAGKQRLSRDTTRDATRQEITALKRESEDLKHLVAELSLDLHRVKKTSIPSLDEGGASA